MSNENKNHRGFAKWMEDFISGLANKNIEKQADTEQNNEDEVLAEININDLQNVVWNDEKFFVQFDNEGANILNQFANVVTTLPGAKNIEEVDDRLNGGQVVANEEELDNILEVKSNDDTEEVVEANIEDELNKLAESLNEENSNEQVEEVSANIDEENDGAVIEAIIDGIDELEKRYADLEKKYALLEQQYARNPELTNLDLGSQDAEIQHFNETASQTEKIVMQENSIDITTPAGRTELSRAKSEIEQMVTEDVVPEDVQPVEIEEVKEIEDVNQDNTLTDKAPVEIDIPDVEDDNTEDNTENNDEDNADENEDTDEDKENIEKLSELQEKIFKNGICPFTGEGLVKSKVIGNFQGVYSPDGGTEYAVNLNTGEIFKYSV